jgi:DNA topoisomerase-6 subunit B
MLQTDFTRISSEKVKEIGALCSGVDLDRAPKNLSWPEAERIVKSFAQIKWIAPDMDTLVLIGPSQNEKSLKNILAPEQLSVVERKAKVFRGGIPFAVEAAIAFGGKAGSWATTDENGNPTETRGELLRFANRVPLLFDAGTCATTTAVKNIDWARYNLKDWENMPVSIFINFVSVYVPYTGAGKLAISSEEEIVEEIRAALMEAGREIARYLNALEHAKEQEHRRSIFFRYIEEVAECLEDVTGKAKEMLVLKLRKIAKEKTEILLREGAVEEGEELVEVGAIDDEPADGKDEE